MNNDYTELNRLLHKASELAQTLRDGQVAIHSPEDVFLYGAEMSTLEQEELWILNLDTRNYVLELTKLYRGSLNSTSIRIGEIFKAAVRLNAAAIIVMHNHPSGDPQPSPEDVAVTKAMFDGGELLDIEVLDHIIFGSGTRTSLKARGFFPTKESK